MAKLANRFIASKMVFSTVIQGKEVKKKDAYTLGAMIALLEKQYGVSIEVQAHPYLDSTEGCDALLKGFDSVEGKKPEETWSAWLPSKDGVYEVQDATFNGPGERWARYVGGMGWSRSVATDDLLDLKAPTLPIIEGRWTWR